jgi:apolipoprotein D and lipocalin family protein
MMKYVIIKKAGDCRAIGPESSILLNGKTYLGGLIVMKLWRRIFVAMLPIMLSSVTACSKAKPSHAALERAPSMDIGQMNGDWHVVARIPTILDREATDMHMLFRVKQDYSMEIDWSFKKNPQTDDQKKYALSGQAGRARDTTLWTVSPIWPLRFTYQVLEFSGDYTWVVVGSADRKYLWILARSDKIDPLLIDGLLQRMQKSEFDVAAVVRATKMDGTKQ